MKNHLVLRVVAKLLIPLIMLFALYVQFHGDFGPGGGFQAGVIFAAAIILYGLIFDLKTAMKVIPPEAIRVLLALGVLLFGGVGIACGIGMAGYRVMDTIGRKITTLTNTRGFSVDFAAATTVMLASKMGLPVSTTHAAVGGVMGVYQGMSSLARIVAPFWAEVVYGTLGFEWPFRTGSVFMGLACATAVLTLIRLRDRGFMRQ